MNEKYFRVTHDRWMDKRNRKQEDSRYKDEWYESQCLRCKYFIPLSGIFKDDYGACSCEKSIYDGHVRFEHDGCESFEY